MKANLYPIACSSSSSAGDWRWLVVADDRNGERRRIWKFRTRAEARKKLAALRRVKKIA